MFGRCDRRAYTNPVHFNGNPYAADRANGAQQTNEERREPAKRSNRRKSQDREKANIGHAHSVVAA
jgi:hypothetical protein